MYVMKPACMHASLSFKLNKHTHDEHTREFVKIHSKKYNYVCINFIYSVNDFVDQNLYVPAMQL